MKIAVTAQVNLTLYIEAESAEQAGFAARFEIDNAINRANYSHGEWAMTKLDKPYLVLDSSSIKVTEV